MSSNATQVVVWDGVKAWDMATVEEQMYLEQDWAQVSSEGFGWDEYVEGLDDWLALPVAVEGEDSTGSGGTVRSYLAECGYYGEGGEPAEMSVVKPAVAAALNDSAAGVAVVAAAEAAMEDEAAARVAADKLLKGCFRAYCRGEKAYRAGLLEAGKLGHEYVLARMSLGDKRHNAVDTMRLELQRMSSGKVDVHRLIGSYWAWQELAVAQGLEKTAETMPYGHYKAGWCLLVDRVNKDTAKESWALLPGMEKECRELYKSAAENGLSREAVETQAKALVASWAKVEAEKAKAAEVEAKRVRDAAKVAVQDAVKECGVVAAARDAATDTSEKERLAAELVAKQAELAKANVVESKATVDVSKAAAKVEVAAEKAEKAEEKAIAATEKAADKVATPKAGKTPKTAGAAENPEGRLESLLKTGRVATTKDAAEMAAMLISGHTAPDDVLELVLGLLKSHKDSSRVCQRACESALLVLQRAGQTSAVAVNRILEANASVPMVQGEKLATAVAG